MHCEMLHVVRGDVQIGKRQSTCLEQLLRTEVLHGGSATETLQSVRDALHCHSWRVGQESYDVQQSRARPYCRDEARHRPFLIEEIRRDDEQALDVLEGQFERGQVI